MPEVQEVFRMATQKVRPDPGALERQHQQRRQKATRRRLGTYALVAAAMIVGAIFVTRIARTGDGTTPGSGSDRGPTAGPPLVTQLPRSVPGGPLAAGTYRTGSFDPVITFTVGEAWWVGWDHGDGVELSNGALSLEKELETGFVRLSFWDTTTVPFTYGMEQGKAPSDFVAFMRDHSSDVQSLTVEELELGGVPATLLDFKVGVSNPGFSIGLPGISPNVAGFVFAPEESQHWYVLDTDDGQLLINWTIEDTSDDASTRPTAEAAIEDVLATLQLAERP